MRKKPDSVSHTELKRFMELDTSEIPPKPKGYKRATDPNKVLKVTSFATMFNAQNILALRQHAETNKRLQKALGKRFAFMNASLTDTGDKSQSTPRLDIRFEYFNYVTNRAVLVWFIGETVKTVRVQRDGYQPAESREEIAIAEHIVRRDRRYKKIVENLSVRGILTPSPKKGHRYLYLMFKNQQEPAVFYATIDITAGKIVEAGPIKYSVAHSEGEQQ